MPKRSLNQRRFPKRSLIPLRLPAIGETEAPQAPAAEVMATMPTRCPPDAVLQHPHEADHMYHQDWTRVQGSGSDNEKWELELKLRERRDGLLREKLTAGFSVFYKSSGNSMWPLVHSGDACTFHPIQAVTRGEGQFPIFKGRSEIGVGDIVFCQVQPSLRYYAHIVRAVKGAHESSIGNIKGLINGWCYREHIFGILVDVQVVSDTDGQYYSRPHPKELFEEVSQLVEHGRNDKARYLCMPSGMPGCNSYASSSSEQRSGSLPVRTTPQGWNS